LANGPAVAFPNMPVNLDPGGFGHARGFGQKRELFYTLRRVRSSAETPNGAAF
jgi:hypothetical protein